jgi:hypothetical protein
MRVINAATGELLGELVLDTGRSYPAHRGTMRRTPKQVAPDTRM